MTNDGRVEDDRQGYRHACRPQGDGTSMSPVTGHEPHCLPARYACSERASRPGKTLGRFVIADIAEPGGTGVVAHIGLHSLCPFANRLGRGDSLSSAIPVRGERSPLHDRGKISCTRWRCSPAAARAAIGS